MSPSGGAGASNAMHDAIALANRINGLPFHPTADEIEAAFMEYQNERIGWVNAAFENSKMMHNIVGKVTIRMHYMLLFFTATLTSFLCLY